MKVTTYHLEGNIKNFPIEIVTKMLKYRHQQFNDKDISVFQTKLKNAFNWEETPEGHDFWQEVIMNENFELFFARYPVNLLPLRDMTLQEAVMFLLRFKGALKIPKQRMKKLKNRYRPNVSLKDIIL